jgi:polyribonucleotide nucleotidyltransferase
LLQQDVFLVVSSKEKRPSDSEVLTMRLVDRVLRPLFPDDYHAEVQVNVMSMTMMNMPDALAGLAASSLALSNSFQTNLRAKDKTLSTHVHQHHYRYDD